MRIMAFGRGGGEGGGGGGWGAFLPPPRPRGGPPQGQATKRMCGRAARLLPYVECSTPDGKEQLQICKDKDIKGYPTWTFANSTTTLSGEQTLDALSAASGCSLPQ